MLGKSEIRIDFKRKRAELSKELVNEISKEISKNLINTNLFKNATSVMLYIPLGNEADTEDLIKKAFNEGKTVAFPVTSPVNFEITPYYADKNTVFEKGTFNVSEPQNTKPANVENFDLVVVPGIAFDKKGGRIGFGKGCYDKLLKNYKGIKVGFCYDFQVADELPADETDVKMNYIVTENGVIECK